MSSQAVSALSIVVFDRVTVIPGKANARMTTIIRMPNGTNFFMLKLLKVIK